MEQATFEGLIEALRESAVRLDAGVRTIPAARWEERIQTGDGTWTRRQLLAHMAANDLRQLVRIRIGAGIALDGDAEEHERELDTPAWNQARVDERDGRSVDQLLAEMRMNREALVALLLGLTPEQRIRSMPFRGRPTPLEEVVPALIGHLDGHAQELAAGSEIKA